MTEDDDWLDEWDEAEAAAERIAEVKGDLASSLNRLDGVTAFPWKLEGDIEVHGPLSVIVEWARGHRPEIEELG